MEVPVLLGYTIIRYYWSDQIAMLALTSVFLILLEVEYARLEMKLKIPDFLDVLRPHERNNVTGSIFFVAATIICFATFDYGVAMLALLLTVFGDLASALIGIKFGKHKAFKSKTFEGYIAGLVTDVFVGYLMFPNYPAIYITMGVVASTVELFTGKLDDNLTVPLFAGFSGQIIAYSLLLNLGSFPGPSTWIFHLV